MAAGIPVTFWAFVHYVKNNRFKTFESMTEDEFSALAQGYVWENAAEFPEITGADTTAVDGTYTDIAWPGGVQAVRNRASCDQADYPECHVKKAVYHTA